MLKLDRLELSGFKSFVEPVELRFSGGVTGIVGPNGCGKSNLSDAIQWVLGEQSAKTLRGDTMEDVIFNGSEKRKPLGMGEVTVTMACPPGLAGSEDGRIVVSRRVFRSGESQYRLNGRITRLKDIKDLLMDTGLGVRAYSVIEQGKIGLILSGKPQERRKLIEEAAGVTRYKARKRLAEIKLEEATANLHRLDDIISEVERNLRSLKRQAGAARRYQERRAEQKELERTVLLGRWAALEAERRSEREALAGEQAEAAERAAELHRDEAGLAAGRESVEAAAQALAERDRSQTELAGTIESRQQLLVGARRTVHEIEARVASGTALSERLAEQIENHAAALRELGDGRAALVADHDAAAAAVDADGEALRGSESAVRAAEARQEEARRELLASLGRLNDLKARLHREQIEREKGTLRERHLSEELERRRAELGETTSGLEEVGSRLGELAGVLAEGGTALAAERGELDAVLARESATAERRSRLETERATIGERLRLLADLAAADEESAAALTREVAALGLEEMVRLRDRVRVLAGWERSLDHFLGPLLDALVLPGDRSPLEIARRLAEGGRAAGVLLAPAQEGAPLPASPADPAIVASIGDALGLEGAVARALPPAYLVDSVDAAHRLAVAHPGVAFLARQSVWAEAGLLHLEGGEATPGFLARTSELVELEAERVRVEAALAGARDELAALVEERARRAEAIRRREAELAALRQEEAVARSRRDELGLRRSRLEEQEAGLAREHVALLTQLASLAELHEEMGGERLRIEALHGEHEARFDALQAELERLRGERESLRAVGAGRRGQLDVLAERLRSLEQQAERFERETEAARRQIGEWKQEAATLADRRGELEESIAAAERELQDALEARAAGEDRLREAGEALEERRQAVKRAEAGVVEARARHEEARGRVEERRVALAGLDHDATHLAGEIRSRCGQEPPEVPGDVPENLAELLESLERLNERIEAMGPVNVLAAEEATTEEERHVFLTTQRGDVAKSVESLRQTIREINQTSSARFKETFELVNAQFSKTFVELFRGGEAEMRLMDEEDLLESGVEIVARPPGKRLQNLMLLSGGEKALTAIALLFALFRIKPSPFCILDEVDAPLDDVNTLRYVGMLRELAKETQCIVITHNKLTMEVASTLYGVTMEERGVSKLIQVELEDVHPEAQTA